MATETKVCGLARPENGRNIFCRKPAVGWLETPHGRVYICEEHRVPNMTTSEESCACPDWEPCPCGAVSLSEPPHCMYCCLSLTRGQRKQFDFESWEHIPPRPKALPLQITCGHCGTTIDNPTQEQIDFHFNDEHLGLNQIRRSAVWTPKEGL